MRVFFQKLRVVTVSDCEEKIALLAKVPLNATDDRRTIEVADLLSDHSDHVCAFRSQIASVKTGTIVELMSGGEDSLLGMRRHRAGRRGFVQYRGAGSFREAHALGHHLQGYGPILFIPFSEGCHSGVVAFPT